MAFYRMGGSGLSGGRVTLPDNISSFTVGSDDTKLTLVWSIPEDSEMEIDKFNIYTCKSEETPTSVEDFTLHGSVEASETSYEITGLENDSKYFIIVESVGINEFENASLRNMNYGVTRRR